MSFVVGRFVIEMLAFDNGRQVTTYLRPAPPEANRSARDSYSGLHMVCPWPAWLK
jgi:hypothetical protein